MLQTTFNRTFPPTHPTRTPRHKALRCWLGVLEGVRSECAAETRALNEQVMAAAQELNKLKAGMSELRTEIGAVGSATSLSSRQHELLVENGQSTQKR